LIHISVLVFTIRFACVKGGLAVAVPGELAGLVMAHQKFGVVPWSDLVKLAGDLATNGFLVGEHLAESLKKHQKTLKSDPTLQ